MDKIDKQIFFMTNLMSHKNELLKPNVVKEIHKIFHKLNSKYDVVDRITRTIMVNNMIKSIEKKMK